MTDESRWARDAYPDRYRDDVNRSIGFSGIDVDLFTRGKADDVVRVLDTYLRGGSLAANALDIGCGIGIMHPLLAPRVAHLSGADVSADAIASAREENPTVDYRSYEPPMLPYADDTFDFCSTVCVMHHVPPGQWPAFVAEAWRVTRPGGLFAIYEHNPLNPLTRVAVWRCAFDHDAVLLRARRTIDLLREQGFEMVERRYLFFVPLDARWARRVDRLLGWLPLGAQYVVCARKPVTGGG